MDEFLRPRLADHVVARLHRRAEGERLVLFDARDDRLVVLDAYAWTVLQAADGTRDLKGIAAAAARMGARSHASALGELFGELAALGWLADGAPEALLEGAAQMPWVDDHRPIRELVAARYRCDGRGGCCGQYPTISVTPTDVHRVAETVGGDAVHRPHRVFLPVTGSAPTTMRALALVDGACIWLESDGRCGVHRRGGAGVKPVGCRWYPTRLVDDGIELRAAPALECACVAQPDSAAPSLLPDGVSRASELPLGVTVVRLPSEIAVHANQRWSRQAALDFIDGLELGHGDPAALLWDWAQRLRPDSPLCGTGQARASETVAQRFAQVAQRAATRAQLEATWRGEDDHIVHRLRVIGLSARLLSAPSLVERVQATAATDLERHAFAVGVFSRQWLQDDDVCRALRDQALQMWLARATVALIDQQTDTTLREAPLAAVTAMWRIARLGAL